MYNPFIKNGKLYGQDFTQLKASCLRAGTLFEDDYFPPTARSVYYSRDQEAVSSYLSWVRPGTICQEPQMVVDGVDRHDINQVQNTSVEKKHLRVSHH